MSIEDFESAGDIASLIADLAPDVSWADDLPIPTPNEIRARVGRFSSEERAAAEREAIRVEFGDTAITLAKGSIERGDMEEAERWLMMADEYHVPEAQDWLDQIAALRNAIPEDADEDAVLNSDDLVASATRHALAMVENARIESNRLVDSGLARLSKIYSEARYSAAKCMLSASLMDLVKADRDDEPKKPTLLWLLWLLFDWLGLPIAKPFDSRTELIAVRVQRGTALSNLLSPVVVKNRSTPDGVAGFAFRVLLLEDHSRVDTPWLSINVGSRTRQAHLPPISVKRLRRPDYAHWAERSHRLLVALPHSMYVRDDEPNTDILAALFEHVMPRHGLTTEQVKRLAWEMVQDIINQRDGDALPLLTNPLDASDGLSACQNILHFGTRLVMDGEIRLRWWRNDRPQTGEDATDDGGSVHQDMPLSEPGSGSGHQSPIHEQREHSRKISDSTWSDHRRTTVGEPDEESGGRRAESRSMTVDQALQELDETDGDYVLFDDIDSGHPTVVYRRAGSEHGVIKFAEPVEEHGCDAVQLLSSTVLAQEKSNLEHESRSGSHASHRISETPRNKELDEFDEFLIIDCLPNLS